MTAPITPGSAVGIVRGAVSLVGALKGIKTTRGETPEIIRAALRVAASPDVPDEHHVRKFAEDVEKRMWDRQPAVTDASRLEKVEKWFGERSRTVQRKVDRRMIDWPDWRSELEAWVRATVSDSELVTLGEKSKEWKVPTTAKGLAKRLPKALYDELQRPPKTDYRLELLTRLDAADELDRRAKRTNRLAAATGAGVVGAGALVGIDAIDVAEGVVVPAFTAALAATSLLAERRSRRRAARQAPVRRFVRDWVVAYQREVEKHAKAGPEGDRSRLERLRIDVTERLIPRADGADDDDLLDDLLELENVMTCREHGVVEADEVMRVLDRVIATATMTTGSAPQQLSAGDDATTSERRVLPVEAEAPAS